MWRWFATIHSRYSVSSRGESTSSTSSMCTSPVTYLGSTSPWRENKLVAASCVTLPQYFPKWLAASNPSPSHHFTSWTSHESQRSLWSSHACSNFKRYTSFSDRTPQLPDWHYSNILLKASHKTIWPSGCVCELVNIWSCCVRGLM